ncbi:MAG: hypothetical protein JJT89_00910 [Nitriliruptoraceae bacterium]|nr:hypothetical protein [Nitriliruptoraceae bacterium]
MSDEKTTEKLKGMGKEVLGKATGQDDKVREGEAQQKKAQKGEEAERLQQEAEHKRNQAAGHKADETRNS